MCKGAVCLPRQKFSFLCSHREGLPKQKASVIKKQDTNSMNVMETAIAVCMEPRSSFYAGE